MNYLNVLYARLHEITNHLSRGRPFLHHQLERLLLSMLLELVQNLLQRITLHHRMNVLDRKANAMICHAVLNHY
jgi:hypothetical protein